MTEFATYLTLAFLPQTQAIQPSISSDQFAPAFEPKERYAVFTKLKKRLYELLELHQDMVVGDVGATASAGILVRGKLIKGSTEGARVSDTRLMLGKVKKVFAINPDLEELSKIRDEASAARESGVKLGELITVFNGSKSVFGEPIGGGQSMESSILDVALLNMVVHHIPEKDLEAILRSAYDALKPGGKLVILDKITPGQNTSSCEGEFQEVNHCANSEISQKLLKKIGFEEKRLEIVSPIFFARALSFNKKFDQWILVVTKPK